jgi:hypothetical protein
MTVMKKIMTHFLLNFGMTIIVIHSHFQNGTSCSGKNWQDKIPNINIHLENYLLAQTFIYNLTNKGKFSALYPLGWTNIFSVITYIMTKSKKRVWSRKYKKSINCRRPKGFSQKQYCKYGRKTRKNL